MDFLSGAARPARVIAYPLAIPRGGLGPRLCGMSQAEPLTERLSLKAPSMRITPTTGSCCWRRRWAGGCVPRRCRRSATQTRRCGWLVTSRTGASTASARGWCASGIASGSSGVPVSATAPFTATRSWRWPGRSCPRCGATGSPASRPAGRWCWQRSWGSGRLLLTLPANIASRRVMEKIGLQFDCQIQRAGIPHVLYRSGAHLHRGCDRDARRPRRAAP